MDTPWVLHLITTYKKFYGMSHMAVLNFKLLAIFRLVWSGQLQFKLYMRLMWNINIIKGIHHKKLVHIFRIFKRLCEILLMWCTIMKYKKKKIMYASIQYSASHWRLILSTTEFHLQQMNKAYMGEHIGKFHVFITGVHLSTMLM
jgi:hypothetical protein